MKRRRGPVTLWVIFAYATAAAGLLWVPLLNVLHAEACLVLAVLAFFAAGLDSISTFERGRARVTRVVVRQWLYLAVPFAIYQFARFFLPGCSFAAGVKYFMLFPMVSVVLAVAIAFALTGLRPRHPRLWYALIGLVLIVGPVLYDLALHPQFYVYNHVFGGVLGPIYDIELADRTGLIVFRILTILWAGVLILVGHRLREPVSGVKRWAGTLLVPVTLIYVFPGAAGINTTYSHLASELGSERRTRHFVIHYDSSAVSETRIAILAADHEFRYAQLRDRLGFDAQLPVHSYLYPDAATRARLIGAGQTNTAPVWLARPQLHILIDSYERSFTHELAHVFSREMGVAPLNAPLHVGLVEGFAVAMEPPDGYPSPDEQVAAVVGDQASENIYGRSPVSESIAASLSPEGFWTQRGAVSYTTMGSFVGYLIREFGVAAFARVYAMESFEQVYGASVGELARRWERQLREIDTDDATLSLATRRFSMLSLFEMHCPHDLPPSVVYQRKGASLVARGDSAFAIPWYERAMDASPGFLFAEVQWADLKLASGGERDVLDRFGSRWADAASRSTHLARRLGDAAALRSDSAEATAFYNDGLSAATPFLRNWRAVLALRKQVAGQAGVVRTAVSGAEPHDRASRLAAHEDSTGAALLLAGLAAAEGEDYRTALALLDEASGSAAADSVAERFEAWRAAFALRAGDVDAAERFAGLAVEAALAVNDRHQLRRLEDFRERIAWTRDGYDKAVGGAFLAD